jgi:two-component system, OmpR family, phosphate regulon response regulator PhoB
MKLLIADDEPAVRKLIRVTFEGDDFNVLEAADGVEALTLARIELPDLLLLDVVMPGLDGVEVCRQLKRDPDTKRIVVLLLTALRQREDRERGLAAGADGWFTKPFSPLALLRRVDEVRGKLAGSG